MLPRVLETEVMDSEQEAHDYDAMDHSHVNRVFASDFLMHYSGPGPVVDVGTGTAQIPIELCRQHATISVVAIDAAESMLRLAAINIQQAGLEDRIRTKLVDAKTLPFQGGSFAAVMSNSIVHHIPEPRTVLAEMVRVAAADGVLFVRDLLRPESDAAVDSLVALYAGNESPDQRQLFRASLHAALSLEEIRGIVSDLGFAPDGVQQTTDRHWTWATSKGT
jgi:ubiquinone/menaquinone biosynthesis C-methylase UbiE